MRLDAEGAGEYFVVTAMSAPPRADTDEGLDRSGTDTAASSFTGAAVTLARHQRGVGICAAAFAERLGLSADVAADLRLAAEWHDAGKADIRFQRWLHGGGEFKALVQPEPLAKGTIRMPNRTALRQARERAQYPSGTRHELMSVALMRAAGDRVAGRSTDWRLVEHLVASHHGRCRPFAPFVADQTPIDVSYRAEGLIVEASSAHGLARLDSGIADGFWELVRRYGWWGLAWLEAIFRLADHRQSEAESREV
jgi:CRISPR-associated endonuclease/helicase Cas3